MKTRNKKPKFGKVGIITGGDSAEKDVALATAKSIELALINLDINYCVIMTEGDFVKKILEEKINMAFIAMHGGMGENGSIQGMLDIMRIPYTGSGVLSSAVCMNKSYSKKIFEYHGIKTPKWQEITTLKELKLAVPVVVKPVTGGSTIATSIVRKSEYLEKAFQTARKAIDKYADRNNVKILIEEYISGREITVGILNGRALPVLEIESMTEFYDYKAKYVQGMSKHSSPEDLNNGLYRKIQDTAIAAFKAVGCKGVARVDFRLKGEDFYILEINTIPGMTQTSLLPEAAELEGIDFNSLIFKILEGTSKKV